MKKFFTEAELGQIKSAVAEAEKATSAEIVPVFLSLAVIIMILIGNLELSLPLYGHFYLRFIKVVQSEFGI